MGEDRQQQQHDSLPAVVSALHTPPTQPHLSYLSHLPLHQMCTSPHPLTLLLLSPSWAGGEMENLLFERKEKTTVIIAKQTHLAFQIPFKSLVTFPFRRQTKLGKKSWDSSLPPDGAVLWQNFPPYSSPFKNARFALQWCQELRSGCFLVPSFVKTNTF